MKKITPLEKTNTANDIKKNSVFFGAQGKENVEKGLKTLNKAFPDHHIHIMDSDIYNKNIDLFIKKGIDWKERESILTYTSNPEHIQAALSNALKIKEAVGNGFFTIKDMVDNTNMTYPQAKSILDLQYAFSFLIKDETEATTKYKIVTSAEDQVDYLNSLVKAIEKDRDRILNIIQQIQSPVVNEEQGSTHVQSNT